MITRSSWVRISSVPLYCTNSVEPLNNLNLGSRHHKMKMRPCWMFWRRAVGGGGGGVRGVCVLLVHNEVLVHNVIHYVPVLLPSHHLQVHNICHYVPVTHPPPHQQPFFGTFKKSTAPYKVHNIDLRYIKRINEACSVLSLSGRSFYDFFSPFTYLVAVLRIRHPVSSGAWCLFDTWIRDPE